MKASGEVYRPAADATKRLAQPSHHHLAGFHGGDEVAVAHGHYAASAPSEAVLPLRLTHRHHLSRIDPNPLRGCARSIQLNQTQAEQPTNNIDNSGSGAHMVHAMRMSVTLSDPQNRWLKAEAKKLGLSVGELLRRIV